MPPLCCASGSHLSLSFPDEVAELQTVKLEGLTAASPCTRQTSDTTGTKGRWYPHFKASPWQLSWLSSLPCCL